MLNLFETFNQSSRDFLRSQLIAKMKIPTVVMHDDGFLPDEVDSPIQYFCDLKKSNHPALYFDRIPVPKYWRIMATAQGGQVFDLKKKRADIVFVQQDNKRLVKEIHWLDDDERINWIEHYDQHGRMFAKTYCSQGDQRVRKYFNRQGKVVMTYNLTTGDVFLDFDGQKRHFSNYSAFVIYFLQLKHYNLDRIFYNTLNEPLGVSMLLPQDQGEDVLFWDEQIQNNELPGNMQYLISNPTRTKHVIFQDYRQWMAYKDQLPTDGNVDFQYLGMIYPHPRGNSLHPEALIITDSDQLVKIEELLKLLPNVNFNIAAITNMSKKLTALRQYPNVRLYPRVIEPQLRSLLKNCDLYLDINKGREILDSVRGAFEQNMLITAFNTTAHDPKFVAQQNVFSEDNAEMMARQITGALVSPKQMGMLVDEQRKEASDVWPKDYERVLGKWVRA